MGCIAYFSKPDKSTKVYVVRLTCSCTLFDVHRLTLQKMPVVTRSRAKRLAEITRSRARMLAENEQKLANAMRRIKMFEEQEQQEQQEAVVHGRRRKLSTSEPTLPLKYKRGVSLLPLAPSSNTVSPKLLVRVVHDSQRGTPEKDLTVNEDVIVKKLRLEQQQIELAWAFLKFALVSSFSVLVILLLY